MTDVVLGNEALELIAAEILIKAPDGQTVSLSVTDGNLSLGGSGRDGDLLIRDRRGSVTIALNGDRGALHLGGSGEDGDITVRNASFAQTAHLDGRTGNLALEGTLTAKRVENLSDVRLKENVQPIEAALDALRSLAPVQFAFKERPDEKRSGFLAQDVACAMPEAVRDTNQGLAIDTTALIALLVRSVQELADEVAELKSAHS